MKRVKTRMFAGAVCEIAVWNQADNEKPSLRVKRERFASAEQYEEFKEAQARRKFVQMVNANHGPSSLKGTLTFDDANELRDCKPNRDGQLIRAGIRKALRCLSNAPTIDAVPVVRCKDCKHWDKNEGECSHWYGFRENDFCSYGERKEATP